MDRQVAVEVLLGPSAARALSDGLDRFGAAARVAIRALAERSNVQEVELTRLYLANKVRGRAASLSLGSVMDLDSMLDALVEAAVSEEFVCEFDAGKFHVGLSWHHYVTVRVGADVDISAILESLEACADLVVRVEGADSDDDTDLLSLPGAGPAFWSRARAMAEAPIFLMERFAEGGGGFHLVLADSNQLEMVRVRARRRSLICVAPLASAAPVPNEGAAENPFFMISGELTVGPLEAESFPFGMDPVEQALMHNAVALPESSWSLCAVVPDDDGIVRGRWPSIT